MPLDMRVSADHWSRLKKHFESSFRSPGAAETGALALLGERRTPLRRELIIADVLLPGPSDLKLATTGALVFDSSFIRRAHLAMRKTGLAGIATMHSHPGAVSRVGFSPYDDREDPLLAQNLMELEPRTRFVSMVFGREAQKGRVFTGGRLPETLRQLIVVGDRLLYLPLNGEPAPLLPRRPRFLIGAAR